MSVHLQRPNYSAGAELPGYVEATGWKPVGVGVRTGVVGVGRGEGEVARPGGGGEGEERLPGYDEVVGGGGGGGSPQRPGQALLR